VTHTRERTDRADRASGHCGARVLVLALAVPLVSALAVVTTLTVTDDDSGSPTAAGAGASTTITIRDFTYSPDPDTVPAHATVTVVNGDGTAHTLTADHARFDTGNLDGGGRATIRVDGPGRYAYHCRIHNYMTGTIVVR
jgi:plastocyanin